MNANHSIGQLVRARVKVGWYIRGWIIGELKQDRNERVVHVCAPRNTDLPVVKVELFEKYLQRMGDRKFKKIFVELFGGKEPRRVTKGNLDEFHNFLRRYGFKCEQEQPSANGYIAIHRKGAILSNPRHASSSPRNTRIRKGAPVPAEAAANSTARIFFTAAWEPVVVRRGDALGLRAFADQFADAVAPDLSNRVRDGRWVTILAWCLARSQAVFHASGGRTVASRQEQRMRYAWLRPLELMWVARTIALADDWRNRSLAGQRRVLPWYEDDEQSTDCFGMSTDQFQAYRQTGMYGGYRLAFRTWPGMTVSGDGWRPGLATIELAKWLDGELGAARPRWPLHVGGGDDERLSTRSAKLRRNEEHLWWLQKWDTYAKGGRNADENTLPRGKNDFDVLPEVELLKPLIFGDDLNGRRRLKVACEVAKATAADHSAVCEHLGRVFSEDRTIALLPRFSRLADAGMETMDFLAGSLHNETSVALSDVAALPDAAPLCKTLMAAAEDWRSGVNMQLRHIETADRFARAIPSGRPIDCLRALLAYHERYGGGLRWFALRDGKIETRTPPRAGVSSRYRFRLWSLCRLATQCGLLSNMPAAIRGDDEEEEDE